MRDLTDAPKGEFGSIRFLLTDMDETLTCRGRLSASVYAALERLQNAGVRVIPTTAAPAGWCDQMARMWPVDGVIGENGGLFLRRDGGHGVERRFWREDQAPADLADRLAAVAREVQQRVPMAKLADDQPFRLASIAFAQPEDVEQRRAILEAFRAAGASATVNNLWVLGWLGDYDKLAMARKMMAEVYGVDIERRKDEILYSGDSTNDAPMFGFFRHTVGVSTVRNYLHEIAIPPRWVTRGPGGAGFVEIAEAILAAQSAGNAAGSGKADLA